MELGLGTGQGQLGYRDVHKGVGSRDVGRGVYVPWWHGTLQPTVQLGVIILDPPPNTKSILRHLGQEGRRLLLT